MENCRERVYLAALLHDIGKFYQRADRGFSDRYNTLSDSSKRMAGLICPVNEYGRFGYQHVVWTNELFERLGRKLMEVPGMKQNLFYDEVDDSLARLACNHHVPRTEQQALITLADWWSAGIDRREPREKEDVDDAEPIKWGKGRYKQIPLYSIFNQLFDGDYQYAFPLNFLTLEKDLFPREVKQKEDGLGEASYALLWEKFAEEFGSLPTDTFSAFSESLIYLLRKYTWCIPSNTMDMANVSLFEHLKTTASFADCLWLYKQENPDDFSWNPSRYRLDLKPGVCPVLLVGGDISGIQRFIYNISSQKAAVSLKGRSFYLQLLIDSIIQRIINRLEVTVGHIVYSSGGKFFMLLPNTRKVKEALEELGKEFERFLWEQHKGSLLFNWDAVAFAYETDSGQLYFEGHRHSLGALWKRLSDKLAERKNRKFSSVLLADYDRVFVPQTVDPEGRICAVTGIESASCVPVDPKQGNPVYVLPSVKEQIDLGNILKDADYILTHKSAGGADYLANRSKFDISVVGVHSYFFDQKELTDDDAHFRKITSADVNRVKRINQTNFLAARLKGQQVSYGFQFYGGNEQAKSGDSLKTFEELASGSYLGILRMDVDNLGRIFIEGLPEQDRSFAAYSTLSFMLDYFFSGYLNVIRKRYEADVNILYAGGDDVFAIGRWDQLLLFARDVRREFTRFAGRKDVTISGGMVVVDRKFPIAKAAELAGDAEDAAKKFQGGKKNALNLFGENISWEEEFDFVEGYKNRLVDLCKGKEMPVSILHRLMDFYGEMKRGEYSYLWHTAYYLTRFANGKSDRVAAFCKELACILCDKRTYELIAVSARWAELEIRFEK
ncbi:type III-A CRISPR-associated protein Cas10/Csm1 [Parabacteroides sp. ZJ-118]|uniref:type III-A CRISPR-associated protein Cas10/Csm1 n=1 Tax=Parabacteroides sp. ZJ-118 TaxID=2709398 RepID=UPI0013ED15DE|nr:type III-A CRISPR-associated protein Cas10/Csm1 [Parabacteroides sp. ZJ-118]